MQSAGHRLGTFPLLHVLARPALRDASLVAALVASASLTAGAVRTAPLLLAPNVPLALAWPFARAALAVSLEVALVVAPAIGAALASARLVDRGEARAVFALGASPRSLVASAAPLWAASFLAAALASAAWGREAEAPGRLVSSLLDEGRASCASAARTNPDVPHAAAVPLAAAAWVCLPGEPPRVVFSAPALGPAAAAARAIELSADTTTLTADDLVVAVPASADRAAQTLHVGHASLRGLLPLGRPSNLGALVRALLLGATACLGAMTSSLAILSAALGGRALALAVGVAGPLSALLAFSALERAPSSLALYALVPFFALFAPFAAARIAKLSSRFTQRPASLPAATEGGTGSRATLEPTNQSRSHDPWAD